jgi:hypothetical protein
MLLFQAEMGGAGESGVGESDAGESGAGEMDAAGAEMPALSPQQVFSAPDPPAEERPASPGEQASEQTQPLGEDPALTQFRHQHHFTFLNRVVFKGKKSAAYSVGLNGNLDVSFLVEQIRVGFRELDLGRMQKRVFRLGLYFSYILRTEEGYSWYSPSHNTSLRKDGVLFPISGGASYVQLEEFLRGSPIVERLSIGLSRASRDSLQEVSTMLCWWFF